MRNQMRTYGFILSFYLLHSLLVYAAVCMAFYVPEYHYQFARHFTNIQLLDALARWDSSYYLRLSTVGYVRPDEAAFFPMYPIVTGGLSRLLGVFLHGTGVTVLAGLLVSNIAFVLGLFFLYKDCEEVYSARIGKKALLLLVIFPTSFYFSAVYTESLFFCFVMAALYSARRSRWLLAGVLTGCAILTRNTGVLVVVSLLVIYYKTYKAHEATWKFSWPLVGNLFSITVVPAFFLSGWLYYLRQKYHNPIMFVAAQKYWGRHFATPYEALKNTFAHSPQEFFFTAVFLLLLVFSFKRIRFEHWCFMLLSMLVLLTTVIKPAHDALQSMPRYVLLMFPAYIYLAMVMKSRTTEMVVVTCSVVYLIFLTGAFSRWYWVS